MAVRRKKMKSRGWQALKANKNKGISMAVMLCVSAFFVAFAAAIVYTSGLLTAQASMRLKQERCHQLAKTYAEVLHKALTTPETKNVQKGSDFYSFVNVFIENEQYAEYTGTDATKYKFLYSDTDLTKDLSESELKSGYGNIVVTLSKEKTSSDNLTGEIEVNASSNYAAEIERLENTIIRQYIVTMEVTSYYEDTMYTYEKEYTREEKYKLKFTHNGNVILWAADANGGQGVWKDGTTEGEDYVFVGDEQIRYEYQKDQVTYCKFVENKIIEHIDTNVNVGE